MSDGGDAALERRSQRRLAELSATVQDAREAAARSNHEARVAQGEVIALRALLEAERTRRQQTMAAFQASHSWRLTAPLRGLSRLFRGAGSRNVDDFGVTPVGTPLGTPVIADKAASPSLVEPARATHRAHGGFPLQGDIAVHPDLLDDPPPPVDVGVSVVIPTRNAGPSFALLLRKLRAQRGVASVEIIVVDSASTDSTADVARDHGCTVVPIAAADFSHSGARNLGASRATGALLLFMVQDAYPVGETWLLGLARALLHPAGGATALSAVSCAEFGRADSELLYDAMAQLHYRFLGCDTADRIGQLVGNAHESLRQQGQLSDVACLIRRDVFEEFRFHGAYAEDLALGVRMIQAGHRIAMLSSIRVIHSHRRDAAYYLRRVFTDVMFLTEVFDDFRLPDPPEACGTLVGWLSLRAAMPTSLPIGPVVRGDLAEVFEQVIDHIARLPEPTAGVAPSATDLAALGPIGAWASGLATARAVEGRDLTSVECMSVAQVRQALLHRLGDLRAHAARCWPVVDAYAIAEAERAVAASLAMVLGAQLGFAWRAAKDDPAMAALPPLLTAGI